MVKFELNKVQESKEQSKAKETYDYDEAVDHAGNGLYNILVLTTCSTIAIAVALDMFAFGVIVAAGSCDLNLTLQQKGLLSSIPFAGIFFAFFWGYFADAAGRRKALIWSTTGGFVFAALTSVASEWYTMLVLKFIGCSFSSASFSLSMTYLGESTGTKHRSPYMQILNCFNLVSETVSFILAYLILNLSFNIPIPWMAITFRPWRLLAFVYAVFLGACALMLVFLYESPKFLASSGDVDKALEVLRNVYKRNGGKKEDYVVKSIILPEQKKVIENVVLSMAKSIVPLFKPPLLFRTLIMFYLIIVICTTNNAFTVWFPVIVNAFFLTLGDGEKKSFCERINDNSTTIVAEDAIIICNDTISNHTLYCGMVYGLFFTVLNLFIAKVANWRRLVLISTFIVSAASCILVDLINHPAANILFFALLQSTSICIGIAGSYFVDLFPTSHRGLVTSLGMMMARIGSFSGINLIGTVIASHCHVTFISWASFVLSGVLVTLLLPSDSKIHKTIKIDA